MTTEHVARTRERAGIADIPASGPVILWHGTTDKFLRRIQKNGIQPRAATGNSVYEGKLVSDPQRVYLTDVYAPQFAKLAVDALGGKAMLVRVRVDASRLQPDTDYAEGGSHGYRPKNWHECLEQTGTASVVGAVTLDEIVDLYIVRAKVWRMFEDQGSHRIETRFRHQAFLRQHVEQMVWLRNESVEWQNHGGTWIKGW